MCGCVPTQFSVTQHKGNRHCCNFASRGKVRRGNQKHVDALLILPARTDAKPAPRLQRTIQHVAHGRLDIQYPGLVIIQSASRPVKLKLLCFHRVAGYLLGRTQLTLKTFPQQVVLLSNVPAKAIRTAIAPSLALLSWCSTRWCSAWHCVLDTASLFSAWKKRLGKSGAHLLPDIRSAFYTAVVELILGPNLCADLRQVFFSKLGLGAEHEELLRGHLAR